MIWVESSRRESSPTWERRAAARLRPAARDGPIRDADGRVTQRTRTGRRGAGNPAHVGFGGGDQHALSSLLGPSVALNDLATARGEGRRRGRAFGGAAVSARQRPSRRRERRQAERLTCGLGSGRKEFVDFVER